MPLEFFVRNGKTHAKQSFDAPTVYFDHRTICDFSDALTLQDRFVKTMQEKRGTFVLSHTNLGQIANANDSGSSDAAEKFLDRLLPNVYLTDFDLAKAEAFEKQLHYTGQRMWPSPDLPMLKLVAARSVNAGGDLALAGFIMRSYLYRDRLSKIFNEVNQDILDELNEQHADPIYLEMARQSVPDTSRTKTRVVMGELMRELMIDTKPSITVNDVVDWQHAVLPVSCCDFALLDDTWVQRGRSVKKRAAQQGLYMSLAKCFSKRDNGLIEFLDQLEAF